MAVSFSPEQVLDLWFPDDGHWTSPESHQQFWFTRMQGGMDETICREFAALTIAAARSELDHWAETPRGRLALVIALDQFPRSLWRDTPAAYAQDIKATRLVLEALENGHYEALEAPWERQFYIIALTHCEGPDHLARMDLCLELSRAQLAFCTPEMKFLGERAIQQSLRVRGIIDRFGRHPHRNPIYGRVSSAAEEAYIATGDFPHVRKPEAVEGATGQG